MGNTERKIKRKVFGLIRRRFKLIENVYLIKEAETGENTLRKDINTLGNTDY